MKKLIFFWILVILTFKSGICQPVYWIWNPVTSPTNVNLNSIDRKYGTDMIAVGDNGTYIMSSGNIWYAYNIGIFNNLFSVNNYNSIFVSGASGTVIYSNNYGTNWISANIPVAQNVNSNTNSCGANYKIVCGDNGILYFSTNHGANWTSLNSGTTNNLRSICYSNFTPYRSYVCGDNGTFRKIVYTLPPIPPIIEILSYNTGVTNNFYCVAALADTTQLLMVGSGGIIMKSTNGGVNWFSQTSGTIKNLRYISAITQNEIWVCGDQGTMLRTINGGTNWFAQTVNSTANLNSILILNSTNGYAVGSGGTILRCEFPNPSTDTTIKRIKLDGNNISAYFQTTGIFNQNTLISNGSGFEWPKGSGKYAVFTSGLSMSAMVSGQLRQAMCSYHGEFWPGRIVGGIPQTPVELNKLWKVKSSDNCYTSVDWANWGLIVPYGAPYKDVNNNGVYDACVDIPGVINSTQTIFMALTDGYANKHMVGEGFGGGTAPMNADMKITAWCYSDSIVADVQFVKFDVINRGSIPWNNLYFMLYSDFDLGDANDDYAATDSNRNMWIGYNADNNDPIYGLNPPAVGMRVLKFPVNKSVVPNDTIKTTSGVLAYCSGCGKPGCECYPNGEPSGAYNFMKGFKKDASRWMDPTFNPPRPVKFVNGGEPEPNTGWTALKGCILNCGGDTGTYISVDPPLDRSVTLSMGKENFTMNPGDSVSILIAQLIARGTSNLNSVTKLKQLSDLLLDYYNTGVVPIGTEIPSSYSLSQNYPNPFNPVTKIKFEIPSDVKRQRSDVKLIIYDILGKEIQTLINEKLNPGTYEVTFDGSKLASGVYFYRFTSGNFIETKKLILLK